MNNTNAIQLHSLTFHNAFFVSAKITPAFTFQKQLLRRVYEDSQFIRI